MDIDDGPTTIDLALSGGGFRATLFHLGVIQFLRQRNWLSRIENIFSVSGGSILAAYMMVHWTDFVSNNDDAFRSRVQALVNWISTRNVSGRVFRSSKWRLLTLRPLNSNLLIKEYDRILRIGEHEPFRWADWRKPPYDTNPRPQLHILTTHLGTCRAGAFSSAPKFMIFGEDVRGVDKTLANASIAVANDTIIDNQTLSRAVAASSAFPPLFAPVSLSDESQRHMLTDGGVYDNIGINHLMEVYKAKTDQLKGDHAVIVSDAGRALRIDPPVNFDRILELGPRVIEAQCDRIARNDTTSAANYFSTPSARYYHVSIYDDIQPFVGKPDTHTDIVERRLRMIRTDLDKFALEEAFVLMRHGYFAAQQRMRIQRCAAPVDDMPMMSGVVNVARTQLEERLIGGDIVRKWGTVRRAAMLLSASPLFLLAVVVIVFAACYNPTSQSTTPVSAQLVTQIAFNMLAPDEQKPFVENAVIKQYFHFPINVPITTMTTMFVECSPPSTQDDGTTIKIQVLIPQIASRRSIVVRPRTTPSTAKTDTKTFVYQWNPNHSPPVSPVSPDKLPNSGYAEFTTPVDPGGAIVIVSCYLESVFKESTKTNLPTAEHRTGWIHVEVSDYANVTIPEYFFAVLTDKNRNQPDLKMYEVWPGDAQPVLENIDDTAILLNQSVLSQWPSVCLDAQAAVLNYLVSNDVLNHLVEKDVSVNRYMQFIEPAKKLSMTFRGVDNWRYAGHYIRGGSRDLAYIVTRQSP